MKTTMYRIMVSDGEKPADVWFDTLKAANIYYDSADCADRPEKVTIDERGRASGGKTGDQTGVEVKAANLLLVHDENSIREGKK